MSVADRSWSDRARWQGRREGLHQILGGAALLVVIIGAKALGRGGPAWQQLLLDVGLAVAACIVASGVIRMRIESSPSLTPPLVLPAVTEPGAFARLGEPRPAFGLRHVRVRIGRGTAFVLLAIGIPVGWVAWTYGATMALAAACVVAVHRVWATYWAIRNLPVEVRVVGSTLEWTAFDRRLQVPLGRLRRVRSAVAAGGVVVLEFDGHDPLLVLVIGGFADFLEALTVTCPWVEVSADVVRRFGGFTGKANGFFVETPEHRP